MDIVHEGWLIKSPPEKRVWRGKWRKRWFVLRHSGHLPGQYLLEYYTEPSCKKLKGKIDLDQCEQIDAGISLESRKWNYDFTFDIRTPKRVYWLIAETEVDMNKWVEYICSVCGLKMHVEEDAEAEQYPASEVTIADAPQPQPSPEPAAAALLNSEETSSLEPPESPTNSYIPMSECISGRTPILNETTVFNFDGSLLEDAPPPPGKSGFSRGPSGEFYDYPRQIHVAESSPSVMQKWEQEPSQVRPVKDWETASATAPRVNWDTYPKDSEGLDSSYGSLRKSNIKVIGTCSKRFSKLQINSSGANKQQLDAYENVKLLSPEAVPNGTAPPPPRDLLPPKPAHLIEPAQCYQNISLNSKVLLAPPKSVNTVNSYDTPPPPDPWTGSVPTSAGASSTSGSLDTMYDFPRPMLEDQLNVVLPAPQGALKHVKHSYTNAPAGYMNDNVFTYDARDVQAFGENYLSMDPQKSSRPTDVYTDMSGDNKSPAVVYSNLPSPVTPLMGPHKPPEVNRDLKPNRVLLPVHSRSCSSTSSTDVSGKSPSPVEMVPPVDRGLKPRRHLDVSENQNFLSLAPPPVSRLGPKHSFRRPKIVGPSLPSTNCVSDHSSSDEEPSSTESSRRNSANEDQQPKVFHSSLVAHVKENSEIQYLDLDLDSDLLQSPKSHERATASTVYKTVDFVKTKAFIEMRHNVEETYRKSQ